MRVSGEEYLRVSRLHVAVPSVFGTAIARQEGLSAMTESGDLQQVQDSMSHVPDVRDDVVASLRERIESGTYSVRGDQVAEMMVRRLLADRVR